MATVAPEHRPTLREELAPLPAPARWAVLGALVPLLVVVAAALIGGGSRAEGRVIVREQPGRVQPARAARDDPAGAARRASWCIWSARARTRSRSSRSRLPAYEGDVGGILPIVAARELDKLKQRFPDLEPVEEGKARINKAAGYSLSFRVSRNPRMYGRLVLLPQPVPGAA